MQDNFNQGLISKAGYLYSPKIIPLAYDEALSYIEQIYSLVSKINNVIETVNSIETDFENVSKNYIDEQVALIKKWVSETNSEFQNMLMNKVESEISSFENEMNTKFNNFESRIMTQITEVTDLLEKELLRMDRNLKSFDIRLSALSGDINKNNDFLLDYFNKMSEELKKFVEDSISYRTGNTITVLNPVSNKNTSLNMALKDLYDTRLIFGITAYEYDSLDMEAETYDNLGITARDYDYNARFYLFDFLYLKSFKDEVENLKEYTDNSINEAIQIVNQKTSMHNPFTGNITSVQEVIAGLAHFHMMSLTAEQYDNKEWTSEYYDGLEVTAYVFDWMGLNIA